MLLLHMAGGGSSVWGPVASRLGTRARVLAPDFPGHGQSLALDLQPRTQPPPGISALLWALTEWTTDFMDALELGRALLCGHSMGAAVALATALRAPDRLSGLGLVCASAQMAVHPGVLQLLQSDPSAFYAAVTGGPAAPQPAGRVQPIFPQAEPAQVLRDFESVDGFDVAAQLAGLRVRTVVVAGGRDVLTTVMDAQRLASGIPGAQLCVVEEGGHLLPRQHPAAVAQALRMLG